jgi:hypothetical protein
MVAMYALMMTEGPGALFFGDYINASSFPPGFWPSDEGSMERGRRNLGKKCKAVGAPDNLGVNPDTGEVVDPNGEEVGDLNYED